MERSHYEKYLEASAQGLKAQAKTQILLFVGSFHSHAEKQAWVRDNIDSLPSGSLRHELFEHVVLPVLMDGYMRGDPESMRLLAAFSQNLYKVKEAWAKMEHVSPRLLLERAHRLAPESEKVASALLDEYLQFFGHCDHEWPLGILFTANAASLDELTELDRMISAARHLDKAGSATFRLAQFASRVRSFRKGLMETSLSGEQ